MKLYVITFGLLLIVGCSSDDPDTPVDINEPSTVNTTVQTSDGINIFTTIIKPVSLAAPAPAVIFIHGNNTNGRTEWIDNDLFDEVLEEGYVVVAYDMRTFGNSGSDGTQAGLFNDPDRAPLDLDAVVSFLKEDNEIDPDRIGAIGSKLGAEVALVGLVKEELQTVIGFSVIRAGYSALSANVSNPQLRSVFYIASELEISGVAVTDAQELLHLTMDPKKLSIVEGSEATGSAILNDDNSLNAQVIDWLNENLR